MATRTQRLLGALGLLSAATMTGRRWWEARYGLEGRVVLITGGSRGLGLLLAREYGRHGARLALVARDAAALERACRELSGAGIEAFGFPTDVSDERQVAEMIEKVIERFGRLDVVVNDAGRIEVGPLESMTVHDFQTAMDTNFWGAFHVINAALQHLVPGGRVVNISSLGGLLSVPHLLPYSASKFALTGFSLGLRMELEREGIAVTTVCPGLMRTGSPLNAWFKGDASAEYTWFSVAGSLPLLSVGGERAARAIVRASRRGDVLLVLGIPAKLAALLNALLPGSLVRIASLATRLLPQDTSLTMRRGRDLDRRTPRWMTARGDLAAARNNELVRPS
ncbi:MAG TPA: SDR family NAD(P)-dependent oxidoreductase [Polyangiaceae bacterium]|nr:SDR family NAD(P)-dependent oxidoreductase [Polyangiaceae bacterium]